MTDPDTADVTYIEPLNVKRLTEIIAKERPDAVLPNLGGQTGLNLCLELYKAGVLEEYGVEVIGVHIDSIERLSLIHILDKLKELNLSHNSLDDVEALSGLDGLETLDLSYKDVYKRQGRF